MKARPRFYKRVLSVKLNELLEEILQTPHEEQVQLYEELAMSRVFAGEALQLVSVAMESKEDTTKQLAIELSKGALNHVKDMVLAASTIERNASDKVSLRVLNMFVRQIVQAIYKACGTNIQMAERIVALIDETVKIPQEEDCDFGGTSATPDMIVEAMDKTIVNSSVDTVQTTPDSTGIVDN